MSKSKKGKYCNKSLRRPEWDYGNNGAYFVTICTKNRIDYFGKPVDGIMQVSDIGTIACKYWIEIPNHFAFVELDSFIIMPDHLHGIIIIKSSSYNNSTSVGTPKLGVPTVPESNIPSNKFNWKPGSLGVIINHYKRICTISIRKINPNFSWQSMYHDRIIRNIDEYHRIRKYIMKNPRPSGLPAPQQKTPLMRGIFVASPGLEPGLF